MSNIIILAGSERKDGNTDMLVGLKDKFMIRTTMLWCLIR